MVKGKGVETERQIHEELLNIFKTNSHIDRGLTWTQISNILLKPIRWCHERVVIAHNKGDITVTQEWLTCPTDQLLEESVKTFNATVFPDKVTLESELGTALVNFAKSRQGDPSLKVLDPKLIMNHLTNVYDSQTAQYGSFLRTIAELKGQIETLQTELQSEQDHVGRLKLEMEIMNGGVSDMDLFSQNSMYQIDPSAQMDLEFMGK